MPDRADPQIYAQVLRELKAGRRGRRALSSLWRRREEWPRSVAKFMFIGDAINQTGRVKFGRTWTGSEVDAYTGLDKFPDFEETLVALLNDVGKSQNVWMGNVEHQSRKSVSQAKLLGWGEEFRRQYDSERRKWTLLQKANIDSLDRLSVVCSWLVVQARSGALETFVRSIEPSRKKAIFEPAYEGFWDNSPAQPYRFWNTTDEEKSEKLDYFIFFSRASLDRVLTPPRLVDDDDTLGEYYLSRYMEMMLLSIKVNRIRPGSQTTTTQLASWIRSEWRTRYSSEIDDRTSRTMAEFVSATGQ